MLAEPFDGPGSHRCIDAVAHVPCDDRRWCARSSRPPDQRRSPPRAALRRVEPARVALSRRAVRPHRRHLRAADPSTRRRAVQASRDGVAHLRRVDARQRRSGDDPRHLRRRRHRRHGRIRRRDLSARRQPRPRSDHAARAGRQRDWRQGRRESRARQEPDRIVLSAARGRRRPAAARDAAAA